MILVKLLVNLEVSFLFLVFIIIWINGFVLDFLRISCLFLFKVFFMWLILFFIIFKLSIEFRLLWWMFIIYWGSFVIFVFSLFKEYLFFIIMVKICSVVIMVFLVNV